jgi:hypothetical protein
MPSGGPVRHVPGLKAKKKKGKMKAKKMASCAAEVGTLEAAMGLSDLKAGGPGSGRKPTGRAEKNQKNSLNKMRSKFAEGEAKYHNKMAERHWNASEKTSWGTSQDHEDAAQAHNEAADAWNKTAKLYQKGGGSKADAAYHNAYGKSAGANVHTSNTSFGNKGW